MKHEAFDKFKVFESNLIQCFDARNNPEVLWSWWWNCILGCQLLPCSHACYMVSPVFLSAGDPVPMSCLVAWPTWPPWLQDPLWLSRCLVIKIQPSSNQVSQACTACHAVHSQYSALAEVDFIQLTGRQNWAWPGPRFESFDGQNINNLNFICWGGIFGCGACNDYQKRIKSRGNWRTGGIFGNAGYSRDK